MLPGSAVAGGERSWNKTTTEAWTFTRQNSQQRRLVSQSESLSSLGGRFMERPEKSRNGKELKERLGNVEKLQYLSSSSTSQWKLNFRSCDISSQPSNFYCCIDTRIIYHMTLIGDVYCLAEYTGLFIGLQRILCVVYWFTVYNLCGLLAHSVYCPLFIGSWSILSDVIGSRCICCSVNVELYDTLVSMVFIGSQCICCSVNVELYDTLVSMGFSQLYASEALKLANNDVNEALQVSLIWYFLYHCYVTLM